MRPGQLCDDCMLRGNCAYTRIFETFITDEPPPFLKGLDTSPRPFIFEPHDKNKFYKENDILWFDLILIGSAGEFMPYIVFSIFQMGQTWLGVGRHPFDLIAAYCFQPEHENKGEKPDSDSEWRMLYEGESQHILFTPNSQKLNSGNQSHNDATAVTLKFLTQTRLKFGNDLTMDFNFRRLVFKMLRRVLELAYFYSPRETINWEFHDFLVAANDVKISKRNLQWEDYNRYSNRQKSKMKMGCS